MNKLQNHLVYLIGSIDKSADAGRGWREDITPFLQNLDIGVFNPCDKAVFNTDVNKDETFLERVDKLKTDKKYKEVQKIMQEIVRIDLNFVDLCNFAILNVDPKVHMCGSYAEQTVACLQRKPVIVHCADGIDKIPNWLFGVCDPELFFDSWDNVKSYIQEVCFNSTLDDNNKKWRFIDYEKVFG